MRKRVAWNLVRWLIPSEKRFYFEGNPKISGQLWYRERIQVHQVVRQFKPRVCFEIGTWRGGGSTYYIAHALWQNGNGSLHTIEVDRSLYLEAIKNYRTYLPHFAPHVEFHLGNYQEVYDRILRATNTVDFVILDGPEDAQETLNQYNFFLPYFKEGAVLISHDWFSEKSRLLKNVIEEGDSWEIKSILSSIESVGLMTAIRR